MPHGPVRRSAVRSRLQLDSKIRDMTHRAVSSPRITSITSATTPVLLPAREHRSRLMAASAAHSSSVVPVAGDAAASSGALASLRRPRSARSETDGGKHARADNQRTAAHDTKRTLRSRGAYHRRPGALSAKDRRNIQSALINLRNIRWALARRAPAPS